MYYRCDHCGLAACELVGMPLEGELVCKDNVKDADYGQMVMCAECGVEIKYYIENVIRT